MINKQKLMTPIILRDTTESFLCSYGERLLGRKCPDVQVEDLNIVIKRRKEVVYFIFLSISVTDKVIHNADVRMHNLYW